MLNLTAGKVPGGVQDITVTEGTTILKAVQEAARVDGEKRGLGRPSFEIIVGDYELKNQRTVDVPQVNGEFYADYDPSTKRWENIRWNDPCEDGDIILVVPKIQGAQFIVSVTMGWDEPRRVAVYEPGDPEGGPHAGTVAQALSAAGILLQEGDRVVVNGELAELVDELAEGDEIYVYAEMPEYAPDIMPEPTEAEVLAISGTDTAKLRTEAEEMFSEAEALREEAKAKAEQAASLKKTAMAHKAKAEAIETTVAEYEAAKARLEELGVFKTYSEDELAGMNRKQLRDILRGFNQKPSVTTKKSDLISAILSFQKVL